MGYPRKVMTDRFPHISKRGFARLTPFVVRNKYVILVCAVAVTAIGLYLSSKIKLDTNLIALLPEDSPSVMNLESVLDKIEGTGDLMVMIESPSRDMNISYAEKLLPKIKKLTWVDQAEIGRDTTFIDSNRLLYMDKEDLREIKNRLEERIEFEKRRSNPFFIDLEDRPEFQPDDFKDIEAKYVEKLENIGRKFYQNGEGTILILVIRPDGVTSDLIFAHKILSEVEELVSAQSPSDFHPDMKISIGGTYKNRLVEYDTIVADVCSGALWVTFGILFLILITFRHPAAVFLICIPLVVSLSATFGLSYAVLGSLNLITVFLFVILFGLGIDYGIHMLSRYRKERGLGNDVYHALSLALEKTGRASLSATLTTAAAFFVLIFFEFRGFSEFGFIAGVGLLFSALSFLLVFPALVVCSERFLSLAPTSATFGNGRTFRWPRLIAFVLVLLAIPLSIAAISRVQFEYDLRKLRSNIPSTRSFNAKMRKVFSRPRDPSVVISKGVNESNDIAEEIRKRKNDRGTDSLIEEVFTLDDMLPKEQACKISILRSIKSIVEENKNRIPEEQRARVDELRDALDAEIVTREDLPLNVRRPFLGRPSTPGELVFIFQRDSLLDLRNAGAFMEETRDIKVGSRTYQAASEPLVYASMFEVLKRDSLPALLLTLLVVLLAIYIDVRSINETLLVLSPLIIGVILMLGGMALFDVKLNLLNAVVLPSLLGLGVDGGIHIFHRYKECSSNVSFEDLDSTLRSLISCTMTSMIGFGGMLVAEHPGLRSIGVLAIIGLVSNLIASILFFPHLISLWPFGATKASLLEKSEGRISIGAREKASSHFGATSRPVRRLSALLNRSRPVLRGNDFPSCWRVTIFRGRIDKK